MNVLFISFAALACLVALTAGVRLWASRNPRDSSPWRGWNIDGTSYKGEDSVSTVRNPDGKKKNVIQILISQGTVNLVGAMSGTQFYSSPVSPETCLTFVYRVFFENDFQFQFGGKLPGLYGGCTAGNSDCFSTRFIWRTGGVLAISLLTADGIQDAEFCDSAQVECNTGGWGHKITTGFQFVPGNWYTIRQKVRLNTPGMSDGYLSYEILRQASMYIYTAKNIRFRSDGATRIDGIMFNAFFGGQMTCSASPKDQRIFFQKFSLFRDRNCKVL